jgi:hypothetical protein
VAAGAGLEEPRQQAVALLDGRQGRALTVALEALSAGGFSLLAPLAA